MNVRELFVSLGLDFDSAGFATAQLAVNGITKVLELAVDAVKALVSAMVEAVTGTVHIASELDDLSKRTGISTDTLQKLGYAAAQSGVGTEELAIGLQNISRQAFAASKGGKEAQAGFARLGISLRDSNGELKSSEALMMDSADAFDRMPDGVEKSTLAMQLFGKSGTKFLAVFKGGSAAIQEWADEAEALGLVISEKTIAAGDELGDNFATLTKLGESWQALFAGPVMDALNVLAKGFKEWVKANREIIKQRLEQVGRVVAASLRVLAFVVSGLASALGVLLGHWKMIAIVLGSVVLAAIVANLGALATLIGGYIAAGAAAVAAGLAAAATWVLAALPFFVLVGIIAFLLLMLEDVLVFLRGGDSLIGDLGVKWTKFLDDFLKPDPGGNWILETFKDIARFIVDIQAGVDNLLGKLSGTAVGKWLATASDFYFGGAGGGGAATGNAAFGGGASPMASVSSSSSTVGGAKTVIAPSAHVTVNAGPGQSAHEIGAVVVDKIKEHHEKTLRETHAAVGG